MSRIGKKPIAIPAGIEVTIDGTLISVKKETMFQQLKLMEEFMQKLKIIK